jgi:predicted metal-dependent enzyme (double-stranded beta helix superfamily)
MDVMDLIDDLLDACRDAMPAGQTAVLTAVRTVLCDPERFAAAVRARPKPWFFAADDVMTVFCTEGRPGNASAPHDHGTWSVLGCFAGSEESWWHRPVTEPGGDRRLDTIGSGVLRAGDVHALAADVVHSVMNRWATPNGVVHVYAGNFLAADRHIWDPVTAERHRAGLSEPLVPVDGTSEVTPGDEQAPLAGTAFAALSVADVAAMSTWLAEAFRLRGLTTQHETCALDEQFTYLIEPSSLTIIGVHRDPAAGGRIVAGLDHLALRVPTVTQLEHWHADLVSRGYAPTPITQWSFGTFTDVTGPQSLTVRLFVPALR